MGTLKKLWRWFTKPTPSYAAQLRRMDHEEWQRQQPLIVEDWPYVEEVHGEVVKPQIPVMFFGNWVPCDEMKE